MQRFLPSKSQVQKSKSNKWIGLGLGVFAVAVYGRVLYAMKSAQNTGIKKQRRKDSQQAAKEEDDAVDALVERAKKEMTDEQ